MSTYARESAEESFWHTYEWSQAVFTIRQGDFKQLLKKTLADKANNQLEELGTFFYPKKYFEKVLADLEQQKGQITKGSVYQGVLKMTAQEMCKRETFSEELYKRLEHDLLTLEGYVRKVILLSAIEGTQNFKRFVLPIVKCYKANKDSYNIETANVAKSCIWRLDRLGRKANVDCVRYLEKNKNTRPYKKYRDVIEEIINRVPDIRKYRNNVKHRSIHQTENSIKNTKK